MTIERALRPGAIAGIGVLWGAFLAALGAGGLGLLVAVLAVLVAAALLAVPSRWHLLRLRLRSAAAATAARRALEAWGSRAQREASALAARARPVDRPPTPSELLMESSRLRRDGKVPQAVEAAANAAAGFRGVGDPHGEALALNSLALALAAEGRFVDAVDALDRARGLLAQTDHRHDEGRVLANLGVVHRRAGGAEAAKLCLAQAIERLDSDSRESEQAAALLRAG